jgi:hypothetical protein
MICQNGFVFMQKFFNFSIVDRLSRKVGLPFGGGQAFLRTRHWLCQLTVLFAINQRFIKKGVDLSSKTFNIVSVACPLTEEGKRKSNKGTTMPAKPLAQRSPSPRGASLLAFKACKCMG